MVALVNIVKMPDSQICLALQVTVNALKSVDIETLQGFFYFSSFSEKDSVFSVHGVQKGLCSGSGPGQGNYKQCTLRSYCLL